MNYRIVTTSQEFDSLHQAWDQIYHASSHHTPYQSWDWNYAWWRSFGAEGQLRLICVEREGALIGVAPFYLEKRFLAAPLPHLRFLGQKRTDYLDFVVADDSREIFFEQVCEALKELRHEWRFVELKDIPEHSANLPAVHRILGAAFPHFSMDLDRVCVTVPLQPQWDEFLQTLGKRTRKDVGYDRRYLQKRFAVDFKIFTNSSAVYQGFADLVSVYQSRWQDEKGAGRIAEQAVVDYENEICERFSKRGDFRLYMLYADQRPVAGLSGYVTNGKYYGDIYAHAPEFHKFSVGNVLLGMAIEDCIGLGLKELDLSRGEESYKYRWNGQAKRNYHLKIFQSRGAMAQAAAIEHLYERAAASDRLNKLQALYRKWRYRSLE